MHSKGWRISIAKRLCNDEDDEDVESENILMSSPRILADNDYRKLSILQFSNPTEAAALVKELTPNQQFISSSSGNINSDNGLTNFDKSNDVQMSDAKRPRNDGDEEDVVESEKDEVGYLLISHLSHLISHLISPSLFSFFILSLYKQVEKKRRLYDINKSGNCTGMNPDSWNSLKEYQKNIRYDPEGGFFLSDLVFGCTLLAYGFSEDVKGYIPSVQVAYRLIDGQRCWEITNQKGLGDILGIESKIEGVSAVSYFRKEIIQRGFVIHENSTGMKEVNKNLQNELFEKIDSKLIVFDPSGDVKITDPSNSNEKPMSEKAVLDLKQYDEDGTAKWSNNKTYHDARIKANGKHVYEVVLYINNKKTSTVTKETVCGKNGVDKVIAVAVGITCEACKYARENAQSTKLPVVINGKGNNSHKRWEITYKLI